MNEEFSVRVEAETTSPPEEPPDEDADTDEAEDEREDEPEDAYALGERLAAMVDAEEARAEAPEATEPEASQVMQHDPYTRSCPTCAGFGVTLTGSIVDGQETRDCPDCRARGWQEKLEQTTLRPVEGEAPHPDAEAWTWG